ncbi:hypothetical protein [Pandoraea pnomenusa]|uniref:hypothetical protein n=1 Tax=Pandoraea pnomenusa TaxID=93220 RepID=UPI0011470A60|nr:hypothetical protein [Pandoraea pnomenusa]QDH58331.1 hypothetical protein FKQ53_02835 [Pandoraea pnomenusa]
MKLLTELQDKVGMLDGLQRAWFTSFNTDIEFVERHLLPAILGANTPRNRLEYEQLQQELTTQEIDFRVFCDPRFLEAHRIKRTCIPVHGIRPQRAWNGDKNGFSNNSLFHPKVIYLEDRQGRRVIGAGSANLTISGWGQNLEAFRFFEVKSYRNYKEIYSFFEQLCYAADIPCPLDPRPRFSRGVESWKFVHSYQDTPFPTQLLSGATDTDLAVWSPYLPENLDEFLQQLELAADVDKLRVHLVADRSTGHVRTGWTPALAQMQKSGRLNFHKNPAHLDTRMELCHAKVWKVAGKLAIGSWNFTAPGSNSLRKNNGDWHPDNNVEAGFIINDDNDWQQACGDVLAIGAEHCATPLELEDEGLVVEPLPPFDLHVSFDWHTQTYEFKGQWMDGRQDTGYAITLPGVAEPQALAWNGHGKPVSPTGITVDDRALLQNRVFRVLYGHDLIMRGVVSELQISARRAQHFESLEDLFDALAMGDDAAELSTLPFRIPLDTDTFEDDATDKPLPDYEEAPKEEANTRAPLSYFRLFRSSKAFHHKLQSLEKLEHLEQQVFAWPGCLQELVDKVHDEVRNSGREVFHWFLVQEVNWLCASAYAMRRKLFHSHKQREPRYEPVPKSRWQALRLPSVKTPSVAAGYLDQVKQQWGQHV